jgi:hypothetical protein
VTDSFWDIQTSTQSTSIGGIGKTTAEMRASATFTDAGWDFLGESTNGTADLWKIREGLSYPRFSSMQESPYDFAGDYGVNFEEYAILAEQWEANGCSADNAWCSHADMDYSGTVDLKDLLILANHWIEVLECDCSTQKQIPRGVVTVDGNLNEWSGNVCWYPLNMVYDATPTDIKTARFALRWNETTNKIYAAIVVDDTIHIFKDIYDTWNASDRLEIYCQGDSEGGTGWQYRYDKAQQYYIAPGTLDNSWVTWAQGENINSDAGLEYAVKVVNHQIIYEVGVTPFDNYGGLTKDPTVVSILHEGHTIGFDVVALTRYNPTGYGMLSENLMRHKSVDAGQFAQYTLIEDDRLPEEFPIIPAGTFDMGDSFGDGDSGGRPVHTVTLDSFAIGKYEITNGQYCDFLKATFPTQLKVVGGIVYASSDIGNSFLYCDTSTSYSYSQIAFSNNTFSVRTKGGRNMSNDPIVCVSWYGAVAYCNWRSRLEGYQPCYDLSTWTCDLLKNGYRLPTEAEWEYPAVMADWVAWPVLRYSLINAHSLGLNDSG